MYEFPLDQCSMVVPKECKTSESQNTLQYSNDSTSYMQQLITGLFK